MCYEYVLLCECASCENDFYIGIDGTQHCNYVRGHCLYERLALRPGRDVWVHIRNVQWAIARYLEDVPNSCLRFEDNKVLVILLTLKGDPQWRYGVDELHPRVRNSRPSGRCC